MVAAALVVAESSESDVVLSLPIELSSSLTSLRVVEIDRPPVIGLIVAWVTLFCTCVILF